jgi:hypothetical protein
MRAAVLVEGKTETAFKPYLLSKKRFSTTEGSDHTDKCEHEKWDGDGRWTRRS